MKQSMSIVALILFLTITSPAHAQQENSSNETENFADMGQWQLLTGRVILRENVTTGEITEFRIPVGVRNNSTIEVNVSLSVQGPLSLSSFFEETSFLLQPKTEGWKNLTVRITQPGAYFGTVLVKFSRIGLEAPAGLGGDIIIYASDPNAARGNQTVPINQTGNVSVPASPAPSYGAYMPLAAIILILIALAGYIAYRKR